jgi:phosphoribosyl 1,2-cyclic phosphodiesterase
VLNFCLLGSGSSGNAIVVASDDTQILIDCGLSYRELARRADMAEISLESLSAVLLTHEHGDHAGGIGTLCRKHGLPVYMTAPTLRALPSKVGVLPCTNLFQAGAAWEIGELRIESFSVTHDAADPVGYAISARGAKVGFAFDLGAPTHLVRQSLSGSHALVLETNYCPELLSVSDYPESVKQRIRSRFGHLSNDVAAQLLKELLHPNLSTVVLVHISENNNTPLRAQQAVQQALGGHGAAVHLASQDRPTPRFRIAV